jgi:zinc/manganese transport system substrate-binding protein
MAGVAICAALLAGCAAPAPTTQDATKKLNVVATFSIIGDLAANIGGDKISLVTLVGPEGDVHDYEPTPADTKALADADVILENGLEFEAWLPGLYSASRAKAKRAVLADGIQTRDMVHDGTTEPDPHIWQNVAHAIRMSTNIATALSAADPANSAVYKGNADAYIARLTELDKMIESEVAKLPPARRRMVTSHDALGYFAERYGFEVTATVIDSPSTESGEPSAAEFAKIVDEIKASGVKAIFLENMSSPALVERVARETNTAVGPALYTDALGPSGSPGATYIDAMRHNARTIVAALGG